MKQNPRYQNGEASEEEILSKFLNNFETTGIKDGMVSPFLQHCMNQIHQYNVSLIGVKSELP